MVVTRLTRMLKIRHPVVQAALGGIARAELAAAVSNAGGLGTLAMIRMPPDFIRTQIRKVRTLTDRPFAVNLVPPVSPDSGFEAQLAVCIEERVPVISLFWCDAAPFVDRCHAAGAKVMLQVGSVAEARAAADAGVDLIIAQGTEAGGHNRSELPLFALLPSVAEAVAPVPVLAAGGIANGRGLAAVLCLGAHGGVAGTRFVASVESEAHPDYKQRLVNARNSDTTLCDTFHIGWPPDSPHRVLRNALTDGAPAPSGPIATMRRGEDTIDVPAFSSATPSIHVTGSTELMANYAGQGVGLVHEILPAGEIVEKMMFEAEEILRRPVA
jgi:NAD(P)H-dependent flavin oxidoreductase YrpB (nitropropane dioxygenase family)